MDLVHHWGQTSEEEKEEGQEKEEEEEVKVIMGANPTKGKRIEAGQAVKVAATGRTDLLKQRMQARESKKSPTHIPKPTKLTSSINVLHKSLREEESGIPLLNTKRH